MKTPPQEGCKARYAPIQHCSVSGVPHGNMHIFCDKLPACHQLDVLLDIASVSYTYQVQLTLQQALQV